jgi:hypothetical protein
VAVGQMRTGPDVINQVMVAVRCLDKEQGPNPSLTNSVTSTAVIEAFERADVWLKPMRP